METRRVTIRILGTEGVGKTSLLELLGKFAARSGAGGEIPGGCRISMKGVVLDMLETHFSDLDSGAAEADMWYLVVGADDGPLDIDELLRGRNMRFDGVFFNKFDLLGYDDELIELAMIETGVCSTRQACRTRATACSSVPCLTRPADRSRPVSRPSRSCLRT